MNNSTPEQIAEKRRAAMAALEVIKLKISNKAIDPLEAGSVMHVVLAKALYSNKLFPTEADQHDRMELAAKNHRIGSIIAETKLFGRMMKLLNEEIPLEAVLLALADHLDKQHALSVQLMAEIDEAITEREKKFLNPESKT